MDRTARLPLLIFFHIPKTAGSALTRFLRQLYGRTNLCRILIDPIDMQANTKVWTAHFNWEMYQAHHRSNAVSMIFLRKPQDRLLSAYYFARAQTKKDTGWFGQVSNYNAPLLSVLRAACDETDNENFGAMRNACVKHLVGQGTMEQTLKMQLTENHIDDAIERLEGFDILGLTERMNESREFLLKAVGVRAFRPDVPVFNTFEDIQASPKHRTLEREEVTPEMSQMIDYLTEHDRKLYRAAVRIFEARLARRPEPAKVQSGPAVPTPPLVPLAPLVPKP